MIELICQGETSEGDLEAFRLLKPIAGKFIFLTAIKPEKSVSTRASMQFENLTIHFSNLNIGYDGMGPGCLVQILAELGMDKDSMTEVVKNSSSELTMAGPVVTVMR